MPETAPRGSPAPRRRAGSARPPARRDTPRAGRAGAQRRRRPGRSSQVRPIRAATSRSMNERISDHDSDGRRPAAAGDRARGRRVPRRRDSRRSTSPSTTSISAPRRRRSSATRSARAPQRGVRMRFAYNVDHADADPGAAAAGARRRADRDRCRSTGKAIAGIPDLMHHKYVIRDGADVWTGSLNWTDDSWSRQENVVAVVDVARRSRRRYELDFDQLWSTGDVMRSGFVDPRWDDGVRAWFTPGHGEDLSARIAKLIRRARQRVRICSPVITTGPVLGHARPGDRRPERRRRRAASTRPRSARCPPVAREPERLLEAAAPRARAWPARSPARSRRPTAPARCTTSCTRR